MAELAPIKVLINGEVAGKTIKDLQGNVANLARELQKLPIASEEWIKKAAEFDKAKANLANARDAAKQVSDQINRLDPGSMKALQAESNKLAQELSKLPARSAEFVAKAQQLELVNQKLRDASDAADEVASSLQKPKQELSSLAEAGQKIAQIKTEFGSVTAATKAMEKEVLLLSQALKKLPEGSSEFTEKANKLESVTNRLKETKDAAEKVNGAFNGLSLESFGSAGQKVADVKEKFGGLRQMIGAASQSFGVLRLAIVATGIGALVILLTSVVLWFQRTDDGARTLDGIMRGIGNTIDVLVNRFLNLGQTIKDLFSNPSKFFKDLGKDIQEGVKAGKQLADTLDDIDDKRRATDLETAKNETQISKLLLQAKNRTKTEAERVALLKEASQLERENHKLAMAQANAEIEAIENELATKVRNANTEVAVRGKKDAELIALATVRKDKEGKTLLNRGTIDDKADLDRYNAARLAKLALERQSDDIEEKINNRRDALEEKAAEKRQKALEKRQKEEEEAKKKLDEIHKAELEASQQIAEKQASLLNDETERKVAAANAQAKKELDALAESKATEEQKAQLTTLIEQNLVKDVAKIREDGAKAEKDRLEKAAADELALRKRQAEAVAALEVTHAEDAKRKADSKADYEEQQRAAKALLDAQVAQIKSLSEIELENTQKTEDEKAAIKADALSKIGQLEDQYAQEQRQRNTQTATNIINGFQNALTTIADFQNIASQKDLSRAENDKNKRLKTLDAEYKAGKIAKDGYEKAKAVIEQDFSNQTASIKTEQALRQKEYNVASAIMQGAIAVLAASANPLGILSPTAIATAAAAAINVAKVIATPIPQFAGGGILPRFAGGGIVQGPSHAQGGVPVVGPGGRAIAEVEGGEPILSRSTYANNKSVVDMLLDSSINRGGAAINIDTGVLRTVRFESGGVIPNGGQAGHASQAEVAAKLDKIAQMLEAQHQETVGTIRNVDTLMKAYVITTEVGESLDDLRALRRDATGSKRDGKAGSEDVKLDRQYSTK